jgi:hypothetical protein
MSFFYHPVHKPTFYQQWEELKKVLETKHGTEREQGVDLTFVALVFSICGAGVRHLRDSAGTATEWESTNSLFKKWTKLAMLALTTARVRSSFSIALREGFAELTQLVLSLTTVRGETYG